MRRFFQTPLLFRFTQNTPSSSRSWNESRKNLPLDAANNVQSTYQRLYWVVLSTKTNFWNSHCTLVALCSTQSASNAQREWRTAQHRNVFTHCSIQNQVLIVPSPNKKLCQLRALISTSAIGVLRIIEINLSPMCIFCIGKSSNVYIGLIQIERNNTRQYGKCRGKIFSN